MTVTAGDPYVDSTVLLEEGLETQNENLGSVYFWERKGVNSAFEAFIKVAIVTFFLVVAVIAWPSVADRVIQYDFFDEWQSDPKGIDKYLSFWTFSIELLFLLALGTSIFTEWIGHKAKELIQEGAESILEKGVERVQFQKTRIGKNIDDLRESIQGVQFGFSLFISIWLVHKNSKKIYNTAFSKQMGVAAFILLLGKAMSHSPGGPFGFVSFFLFGLITLLKLGSHLTKFL